MLEPLPSTFKVTYLSLNTIEIVNERSILGVILIRTRKDETKKKDSIWINIYFQLPERLHKMSKWLLEWIMLSACLFF